MHFEKTIHHKLVYVDLPSMSSLSYMYFRNRQVIKHIGESSVQVMYLPTHTVRP